MEYVRGSELHGRGGRRHRVSVKTISAGWARARLAEARAAGSLDKASRMNPGLTRGQALGIFEAALKNKAPDDPVRTISAKNILRELGLPLAGVGDAWGMS